MSADVLVDLTPLDTSSRHTGTGRYVGELGLALAALTASERRGLVIEGLVDLDGPSPVGDVGWQGSDARHDAKGEVAWLNARRLRLPITLRRLRPRLFHATYSLGTPRGSGVPRVVTCLDLVRVVLWQDYMAGRPAYRALMIAAEALRFHAARRVQAISQHTADDLMRLCKVPASKIDVVHLGVDLERYRVFEGDEAARAAETRRRYGLTDGGYVFYMGAADPRKNVDTLIEAFARAKQPGLELVLIGKMRPSDEERIARARAAAGDPPGVRLLGLVPEDDLPAIIGGAMAFVFCSTYEGFGNVPVEAMACGCPVVHPGLTSMKETVADAGLLVPPRDPAATAAAIVRLAREAALRRQLAEAGVARAARFSWRNTALASVDSYDRALARLAPATPRAAVANEDEGRFIGAIPR